jgi:hypothetical protein
MRPVAFRPPGSDAREYHEAFASGLMTALTNWARCDFREWWLALTAGVDTRTNLAAALAAQIEVETFTMNYSFMARRDQVLPPRVAARAGVPYRLVESVPVGPAEESARAAVISEHMDGATFHPLFDDLARYDDDVSKSGSTSVQGHGYGIGRCFFWPRFANVGLGATPPTSDQLLDAFVRRSSWRLEPLALWRQAIQTWLDSLSEPIPLELDWRDRFFLEQRLGSWTCNVLRRQDLLDGIYFNPANCLWISYLLLQPGPAQRAQGLLQRQAIRLLAPHLMELPINPEPISKRVKGTVKGTVKSLLGPKMVHRLISVRDSIFPVH